MPRFLFQESPPAGHAERAAQAERRRRRRESCPFRPLKGGRKTGFILSRFVTYPAEYTSFPIPKAAPRFAKMAALLSDRLDIAKTLRSFFAAGFERFQSFSVVLRRFSAMAAIASFVCVHVSGMGSPPLLCIDIIHIKSLFVNRCFDICQNIFFGKAKEHCGKKHREGMAQFTDAWRNKTKTMI